MNKKALSERDICTQFITPALGSAGWDIDLQVREEVSFTDGRIPSQIPFPLPPLAEQTVIVARVESLMEHCRALAAEIAHARTHAANLLQAVLTEAFTPVSTND